MPLVASMEATQDLIVNPSMKEQWDLIFTKAKSFYEANGHLTTPDKTLSQWITYQRLHAKNLSERQIALLESINYKTAGGHRECDVTAWNNKIVELQNFYARQNNFKKLPSTLSTWLYKQRQKARQGELEDTKREQLESMGVNMKLRPRRNDNCQEIRNATRWDEQFQKLQLFRDIHGHCNVPKRYPDDKSLANWVGTQRIRYVQMKKRGVFCSTEWIRRLEGIGFEWCRKPKRADR